LDAVFNKIGNQTFMERGKGPHDMFKGTKDAVSKGQKKYEECVGSDKTKWTFNTQCCAYNRQSTTCKTPVQGKVVVV